MKHVFPESAFAHQWLDGLSGLEIGPSAHNGFGLNTRNVGLGGEGYTKEQLTLTGEIAAIEIWAEAGAIPVPSESEDFILASHVIEHCPDFIKTLLEWYRIVKVNGYVFVVVPHRDAAPSDRDKPLSSWDHMVSDYMLHVTQDSEPEGENFLYCHYHVFSPASFKDYVSRIFGERLVLVGEQDPDDKVGNGFSLVYRKAISLNQAFPWSFPGRGSIVNVQRPSDYYQIVQNAQRQDSASRREKPHGIMPPNVLPVELSEPRNDCRSDIRVSAIVPAYNSEQFMRGVLEDLERQSIARQMEIIVVETGSETQEIENIREFQKQFCNIVYLRTSQRMNATAAVNQGVRIAKGQFITLAPTDDRLRSDALEIMAWELERHPEVGAVYADVFITQFENQTFERFIRGGYSVRFDFSPEMMLTGYHMGPLVMYRKAIHETIGMFNDSFLCASDYEFWCRVARRYPLLHIPHFLGLYLQNLKGTVNSNPEISQSEFRRIIQANRAYFPPPFQKPLPICQYDKPDVCHKYVNIGMVTFNRLEFTKSALAALLTHTCFPHVITVVDNGSTDGTPEYLQALHRQGFITNLILLPDNVGIAKASNLAWGREPEAEYYLKLDNDIVIQKQGWLSQMVEVIDQIPELAAVAYNFEPGSFSIREMRGWQVRPKKGNVNGACVLIPKRTHRLLGFWCEDYGLYGEEDADYGWRIQFQGLQSAYMEDEQIGVHLPAGRAAKIDEHTFKASDGIEEETHAEYRAFKDKCRRNNVQHVARRNFEEYRTGVQSLYCESAFAQTFYKDGRGVGKTRHSSVGSGQWDDNTEGKTLPDIGPSFQEDRPKVSLILGDSISGVIRLIQPFCAGQRIWRQGPIVSEAQVYRDSHHLPLGRGEVWVFQRTSLLKPTLLRNAQAQGTTIIHDCDDLLWKVSPENVNHQFLTPEKIEAMFRLMGMVDRVTVSTEPIRADLLKRGIQATVLPNCLVREEWEGLTPQRRAGARPRIGWAGQANVHKSDIAILEVILEELKHEVEWVFLGEAPRTALSSGMLCETFPMVDLASYPKKLASLNLDLALAPLIPNEFNEAKSHIRILQYGILGYPVIGTDIFSHQDTPILRLPHEPRVWIKAIRERIHDLDALEREGETLRQWVLANRLMEHMLPKYEQAWLGRDSGQKFRKSILEEKPPSSPVYSPHNHAQHVFDCSIIIPIFNKVELTRQCLTHLAEVTDGCSYEVIVVDNNSTDGTKEFLAHLSGDIRVISNPENFGFAKACNQGAAAAKGRYLVFLNNDTIPKAEWLQALVEEVEVHQNVAIVGSKLLYPDGTIQHAGVVFSKNCLTPYHLFNRAPGDLPAANIRREFQAVTAACFLIRKEDFDAVGGFDEGFQNGFEDVDLCLKIRERGRKVVYQPKSVLCHLEHQTPGRKDPAAERHNGKLLMSRWSSKLVVDEDIYTVPAGYANRYYFRDGWLRQSLEPFQHDPERTQWTRVQRVQELLLNRRYDPSRDGQQGYDHELSALLAEYHEWPEDGEVLKWAATLCHSLSLFDLELAFWNLALNFGEDRAAREQLATLALRGKDLSTAAQHVQALLRSDSNDASGHWLQGIILMQSRQCAEAATSFRRAIQCGYDVRKGSLGLGMACLGAGEAAEGWKAFEQVLIQNPDDFEAMNGLIQAGTLLQRWEDLGQRLSRYVERNPADCDMRFALAGVEFRAGHIDSARQQLEMLNLLKPDYDGLTDLEGLLQMARVDAPGLAT